MTSNQLTFDRPGIRETQSSDLYLSEVGESVGALIPPHPNMIVGDLIRLISEFSFGDTEHFQHLITSQDIEKIITIEVLKQVFQDHIDESVKVTYEVFRSGVLLGKSAIRGLKINP